MRAIAASVAVLVAGGTLFALEMWTLVPAPTLKTLAVAVAVPELAPWFAVVCVVAGVAMQAAGRGWPRALATLLCAAALGCALVPLVLLGPALTGAERELRTAIGAPDRRATTAPPAFSLATTFAGYPAADDVRVAFNLPVRTRDGTRLGLDLYRPRAHGPHPAVITIYGGAWIFGSRADTATDDRALAARGYTVIAIDYRHAPRFAYPTQIDDVRDALELIARNARAWEVDPQRVALFGKSAGAQLALLAAYEPGPLRVRAVVAYYAPVDLLAGYRIPPVPDPADVRRILRAYLGGAPERAFTAYIAASPLAHVRAGEPATLLIGGGRDELVRLGFQRELRARLRADGVPVASIELPWSNHAFDVLPNGLAGQIARSSMQRFLAATLGGGRRSAQLSGRLER